MACLSKVNGSWDAKNCKNLYDPDEQLFTCHCNSLSSTTVIEDVESLFSDNNLGVAFGEQGLSNLFSFSNFYEYAVVWMLFSLTLACILLYMKGKALDLLYLN